LIDAALNIEETYMIKLAVNLSMIFTEVPLIERFALARAQGFNHVESSFLMNSQLARFKTSSARIS
jgi:hydroxypyruvate isomerase